ncbi:MAG: hypothetical protein OXC83_03875 [Chloroflexi bacterium]|nr:hypothetical protein [Chloroflexota bacterium]
MNDCNHTPEDIRTHLSMMQDVISRMAENSRACKTWAVTLVAAILVVVARFGTSDDQSAFGAQAAWIALVPTVLFWLLDSYYLALERGFRESYNVFVKRFHARELKEGEVFMIAPSGSVPRQVLSCQKLFAIWPFYIAMVLVVAVLWMLLR